MQHILASYEDEEGQLAKNEDYFGSSCKGFEFIMGVARRGIVLNSSLIEVSLAVPRSELPKSAFELVASFSRFSKSFFDFSGIVSTHFPGNFGFYSIFEIPFSLRKTIIILIRRFVFE